MKIDESTSIPLVWVAILVTFVVTWACTGSFWVKSVNDRLARIEEKLGIHPLARESYLSEAKAGE